MTEIVETGITLDHDEGTIDVSIRSRKIAHRLKSLGFEPENPDSERLPGLPRKGIRAQNYIFLA